MGLTGHGIVFGLGYLAGRPEGRAALRRWRVQVVHLIRHPEAKRIQDHGWNLAEAQARAATRSISTKLRGTHAARDSTQNTTARDDNATAAADLHAALAGNRSPHDTASHDTAPAPGDRAPDAGFGGTTVAEDSHAVILGLHASPPPDPPRPASPPTASSTSTSTERP